MNSKNLIGIALLLSVAILVISRCESSADVSANGPAKPAIPKSDEIRKKLDEMRKEAEEFKRKQESQPKNLAENSQSEGAGKVGDSAGIGEKK